MTPRDADFFFNETLSVESLQSKTLRRKNSYVPPNDKKERNSSKVGTSSKVNSTFNTYKQKLSLSKLQTVVPHYI